MNDSTVRIKWMMFENFVIVCSFGYSRYNTWLRADFEANYQKCAIEKLNKLPKERASQFAYFHLDTQRPFAANDGFPKAWTIQIEMVIILHSFVLRLSYEVDQSEKCIFTKERCRPWMTTSRRWTLRIEIVVYEIVCEEWRSTYFRYFVA